MTAVGRAPSLGYREFAEWIGKVEQTIPASEWRISGVDVWPMVRLNLYHRNFNPPPASPGARRGSAAMRVPRELLSWAAARARDHAAESSPSAEADAVFLAYSVGAQHEVAGKRLNPLLAPYVSLIEELGKRANVWEMSPFGEYNAPRHTSSALIQPWIFYERAVASAKRASAGPTTLAGFSRFLELVGAARLSCTYDSATTLASHALSVRRLANRFKAWLARTGAKVGFIADYGMAEHAFCLAARELGISTVEIQHGVQGPLHGAYGQWHAVPRGGFNIRPNGYWCWDERDAETINAWALPSGIFPGAFVGGDAWFDMWSDVDLPAVRGLHRELSAEGAGAPGKDILLSLTSTGEVLPDVVLDALRRSPPDWRWWPRLHPANQAQRRAPTLNVLRPFRIRENRIDVATSAPLPGILRQMDAQVVIGPSTVIMQAAQLGIPSIVVGTGALEAPRFFPNEAESGSLTIAESGSELLEGIRRSARGTPIAGNSGVDRARSTMRWLLDGETARRYEYKAPATRAAATA